MTPAATDSLHALIPAGGVGMRALLPGQTLAKQYRLIREQPMLRWAVQALLAEPRIKEVVVGVQLEDPHAQTALASSAGVRLLRTGGNTRALTVLQTLQAAEFRPRDWVLVHDAARPGLPLSRLSALIDTCLTHDRGGILALPASDTVKEASSRSREDDDQTLAVPQVARTLSRQHIWLAQTPQMFRAGALTQALQRALAAGVAITDEASAMEWAGHDVLLVRGCTRNNKVTWAEDFDWVQTWL
jgi:2-C-methyl-D-erythritol 4-phosphate cytidylyltransferase